MRFEWIMDPFCSVAEDGSDIELNYTFAAAGFLSKCVISYKFRNRNLDVEPEISMYGGIDLHDYTAFPPSSDFPAIDTVKTDLSNYLSGIAECKSPVGLVIQ